MRGQGQEPSCDASTLQKRRHVAAIHNKGQVTFPRPLFAVVPPLAGSRRSLNAGRLAKANLSRRLARRISFSEGGRPCEGRPVRRRPREGGSRSHINSVIPAEAGIHFFTFHVYHSPFTIHLRNTYHQLHIFIDYF
jgi:hypothetical protein